MDIECNDVSGLQPGINPTHEFDHRRKLDPRPDPEWRRPPRVYHIDGVFSQGGGNILIQRNYIDAPTDSDVTAAIFIQNRDSTDTGVKVYANYLRGGAYYAAQPNRHRAHGRQQHLRRRNECLERSLRRHWNMDRQPS
jgi:hypothetical protein